MMSAAPAFGCWDLEIGGGWRRCEGEEHERRHGQEEHDEYVREVIGPRNFLLDQSSRVLGLLSFGDAVAMGW